MDSFGLMSKARIDKAGFKAPPVVLKKCSVYRTSAPDKLAEEQVALNQDLTIYDLKKYFSYKFKTPLSTLKFFTDPKKQLIEDSYNHIQIKNASKIARVSL